MDKNSITSQSYEAQNIAHYKFEVDNLIESQRIAALGTVSTKSIMPFNIFIRKQ